MILLDILDVNRSEAYARLEELNRELFEFQEKKLDLLGFSSRNISAEIDYFLGYISGVEFAIKMIKINQIRN